MPTYTHAQVAQLVELLTQKTQCLAAGLSNAIWLLQLFEDSIDKTQVQEV